MCACLSCLNNLCCADMLEVGLPGSLQLSLDQQQAHFALWALVKSPLVIGADLRCVRMPVHQPLCLQTSEDRHASSVMSCKLSKFHRQQQAHFALWALVKSSIVIGADLRCAHAPKVVIISTMPELEFMDVVDDGLRGCRQRVWSPLTLKAPKILLICGKGSLFLALSCMTSDSPSSTVTQ